MERLRLRRCSHWHRSGTLLSGLKANFSFGLAPESAGGGTSLRIVHGAKLWRCETKQRTDCENSHVPFKTINISHVLQQKFNPQWSEEQCDVYSSRRQITGLTVCLLKGAKLSQGSTVSSGLSICSVRGLHVADRGGVITVTFNHTKTCCNKTNRKWVLWHQVEASAEVGT